MKICQKETRPTQRATWTEVRVLTPLSARLAARPLVQTLPLRTTVNNGTVLPKKPSGSLPSPSGTRKETAVPATAKSTIKRTSSSERVSPGGRRESYGDSKGSRNRTGSTSSSSSGKKNSER